MTIAFAQNTRTRRTLRQALNGYGYLSPMIALIIVLMILPIVQVVRYSFYDNAVITPDSNWVGFDNYVEIVRDTKFLTALKNTVIFTGASVIAHLVIGLGFAQMLNSDLISTRTRAAYRAIYVMPWVFTAAIIAVLWRLLLNPSGVVNYTLGSIGVTNGHTEWLSSLNLSLWSVIMINIWAGYPFFMMSLLAGLQGISKELYEAASVDGATGIQRFRFITIPQLRPIITAMALLDAIWTSQQFALIWITTGGGPLDRTEMLSTYTYKLAFSRAQFAQASTSAVIVLLLSLVLAGFYVRRQAGGE